MAKKRIKKRNFSIHLFYLGSLLLILLTSLNMPCDAEDSFGLFHKKLQSQNKRQGLGYMIIEPVNKSMNYRDQSTRTSSSNYYRYRDIVLDIAEKYDMDPLLIHSIITVESDYNPFSVSSKGAAGLMQLMPETARDYGVKNVYNPRENIEGGVKFLKDLNKKYKGREDLILAAYNAGPEIIKKYKGVPPYPETINYIRKVKNVYYGRTRVKSTRIYRFYDSSGRLVLTNNPRLRAINKKKHRQ
jgi:soluble lytic murein transglycosylase-like protein